MSPQNLNPKETHDEISSDEISSKDIEPFNLERSSFKNIIPNIFLEPFQWVQMLSTNLNSTFILGVFLVYGLSQGFAGSFFKVVADYYWKDVQKLQPSTVQLLIGFYYIPWIMKPIWGSLTDVFPVRGYKRRPYFIIAGIIGSVSAIFVALSGELAVVLALLCLIGIMAGVAIADVTIDACIARNSIEHRLLAPDMQILCGFCSSAGALLGYSSSGFFVHHLGPQYQWRWNPIRSFLLEKGRKQM